MKTNYLAAGALALVALFTTGVAKADNMPDNMLGKWCMVDEPEGNYPKVYVRDKSCEADSQIMLRPTGYTGIELSCRFVRLTRDTTVSAAWTSYKFAAKCEGDGHRFDSTGRFSRRGDDTLYFEYR